MFDSILGKMAIGYITALGLGNEYCEGVFDLPASNLPGYRLFLVSVKLYNPDAIDPRLHIGLYQFALFLPIEYMKQLPANSAMETAIISIVKSEIKYADRIVPEILVPLKNRLTRYLDNQISKRNAERLINEIR